MPSLVQLQAESVWRSEVVTPELDFLGDELCRRTGRPRVAAGTKGDQYHLNGSHRSQRWIKKSQFCTNRSYTVQSGLTEVQLDYVAGFDFTPGSTAAMITQCKRIYNAMRAGQLNEIREFYGNVNGDRIVDGWDNLNDRNITSSISHLTHWHLTLDRRQLRNMELMKRIIRIALGDPPVTKPNPPTPAAPHPAVKLEPFTHNALAEVWGMTIAMREGTNVPANASYPGGKAWIVGQINEHGLMLESVMRHLGDMTVGLANANAKLDQLTKPPVIAPPATTPTP